MKAYKRAVIAATLGSFMFGWNMAYLNPTLEGLATGMFPCDDIEVYAGYSSECVDLIKTLSDVCDNNEKCVSDSLLKCQSWLKSYDEDSCDGCKIPSLTSCDNAVLQKAYINAAPCFGALLGCLLIAPALMRRGPRVAGIAAGLVQIAACFANVVSRSLYQVLLARVALGVAVGIYSVHAPAYIQQVVPPKQRGKWGTTVQLVLTFAIVVAAVVGLAAQPVRYTLLDIRVLKGSIDAVSSKYEITKGFELWRLSVFAGMIPSIIAIYMYIKDLKSEPPMFLLMKRKREEAQRSFEFFLEDEAEGSLFADLEAEAIVALKSPEISVAGCFKGSYKRTTLLAILFSVGQQVTGINVFITASSQLFLQCGMDAGKAAWMSTLLMVVNFIVNFPCMFLLDKFGRKTFMMFGIVFMTLGSLPAAIAYWIDEDAQGTAYTALVGCFVFIIAFGMTYGPILWIWLFEIFPEESKGKASSLGVGANWLVGTVMVFVGTYCTNNKYTFTVFATASLVYCPLVYFLMEETKYTKTKALMSKEDVYSKDYRTAK